MNEAGRTQLAFRGQPSIVMDQFYRRGKLKEALAAMQVESEFPESKRSVLDAALDSWTNHDGWVNTDDSVIEGFSLEATRLVASLFDQCSFYRWALAVSYYAQTGEHLEDAKNCGDFILSLQTKSPCEG